jgi:hypothetical protein
MASSILGDAGAPAVAMHGRFTLPEKGPLVTPLKLGRANRGGREASGAHGHTFEFLKRGDTHEFGERGFH